MKHIDRHARTLSFMPLRPPGRMGSGRVER
jgi:hypothetical protein